MLSQLFVVSGILIGGARAPWASPLATPMGRTDVGDDERSRRPTISKTLTITEKVKKLFEKIVGLVFD